MAQSLQVKIGDTVRANFNLVFKRAEVARLRDPENFKRLGFQMSCRARSSFVTAVGGSTEGVIRCRDQNINFDDQPVEVDFVFDDTKLFQINDVWELGYCYIGEAGFPAEDVHPRKHLLATVQLVP